MKRRLEIARGLLHAPRVLFLDEPTVGLDRHTRSLIWEYVNDLKRRESITIFLTTHYMDGRGGALRSHPRSAGPRSSSANARRGHRRDLPGNHHPGPRGHGGRELARHAAVLPVRRARPAQRPVDLAHGADSVRPAHLHRVPDAARGLRAPFCAARGGVVSWRPMSPGPAGRSGRAVTGGGGRRAARHRVRGVPQDRVVIRQTLRKL